MATKRASLQGPATTVSAWEGVVRVPLQIFPTQLRVGIQQIHTSIMMETTTSVHHDINLLLSLKIYFKVSCFSSSSVRDDVKLGRLREAGALFEQVF